MLFYPYIFRTNTTKQKGCDQMKLSMWIIANLLSSFDPEVQIQKDSPRVLRSARLAHATDCVYVCKSGDDCLYCWNEDTIRLHDLSVREGIELLQSLFDSMYDWHLQLRNAIAEQKFQLVVDLCYTVFKNPVTLSDANRSTIALSSQYGTLDVDEEWMHLKTYGCSSIEASSSLAKARISYHFSDQIIRYHFDQNAGLCSCLTAPVLLGGMPEGYLTVLEKDQILNQGHMQMLTMIAELLAEEWNHRSPKSDAASSMLRRLLEGASISQEELQAFCHQKKWCPDHMYRVLMFSFQPDPNTSRMQQIYFFSASLSAMFPDDLVGISNGNFYILANDSLLSNKERIGRLQRQLTVGGINVSSSLPFPGFHYLPYLVKQADFAMKNGLSEHPEDNFHDFYYYALDYLIRSEYSPENCLTLCHPDIYYLYRTDEILFRTLWVYLVQDRSVTRTIEHLYVHKNTLLYRLRKIEELLTCRISEPYSRMYMRLSYMLLERHSNQNEMILPLFPDA